MSYSNQGLHVSASHFGVDCICQVGKFYCKNSRSAYAYLRMQPTGRATTWHILPKNPTLNIYYVSDVYEETWTLAFGPAILSCRSWKVATKHSLHSLHDSVLIGIIRMLLAGYFQHCWKRLQMPARRVSTSIFLLLAQTSASRHATPVQPHPIKFIHCGPNHVGDLYMQ